MTMSPMTTTTEEKTADRTAYFGFWLYLMTDLVLFAALFATYAVLHGGTAGGPTAADIFSAPYVLTETIILLTSSFTAGLALVAASAGARRRTLVFLGMTFLLGASFIGMEASEFARLLAIGAGPSRSAFLSSFFTLVGTHGLHVTVGLLWLGALMVSLYRRGWTRGNVRKLALFTLFWHFLDIIWIFIFTMVYLFGLL